MGFDELLSKRMSREQNERHDLSMHEFPCWCCFPISAFLAAAITFSLQFLKLYFQRRDSLFFAVAPADAGATAEVQSPLLLHQPFFTNQVA